MIDSGSQRNVIKIKALRHNIQIHHFDKIWIKGISNEHLITLITVSLKSLNRKF